MPSLRNLYSKPSPAGTHVRVTSVPEVMLGPGEGVRVGVAILELPGGREEVVLLEGQVRNRARGQARRETQKRYTKLVLFGCTRLKYRLLLTVTLVLQNPP